MKDKNLGLLDIKEEGLTFLADIPDSSDKFFKAGTNNRMFWSDLRTNFELLCSRHFTHNSIISKHKTINR